MTGASSPALTLLVDVDAATPPYEQVRTQVEAHVRAGRLRPGDRLPTVRALAADLGIAVGTVARAYRELEAADLVVSRRRTGTVVAEGAGASGSGEVRAAAASLVRVGRAAGLTDGELLSVVRGALLLPARAPDPEKDVLRGPGRPSDPD